jgi:hypothetical protein
MKDLKIFSFVFVFIFAALFLFETLSFFSGRPAIINRELGLLLALLGGACASFGSLLSKIFKTIALVFLALNMNAQEPAAYTDLNTLPKVGDTHEEVDGFINMLSGDDVWEEVPDGTFAPGFIIYTDVVRVHVQFDDEGTVRAVLYSFEEKYQFLFSVMEQELKRREFLLREDGQYWEGYEGHIPISVHTRPKKSMMLFEKKRITEDE